MEEKFPEFQLETTVVKKKKEKKQQSWVIPYVAEKNVPFCPCWVGQRVKVS